MRTNLEPAFICPRCGGKRFGRQTESGSNGKVRVTGLVDCHEYGCAWSGQWPPVVTHQIVVGPDSTTIAGSDGVWPFDLKFPPEPGAQLHDESAGTWIVISVASEPFEGRLYGRAWFRDWDHWDQQIKEDSEAGKLDFLREEV